MITATATVDDKFFWLNPPDFRISEQCLQISTSPNTDLWQKTHYGFVRDNAHCLLTAVSSDFSISVRARFQYKQQYDQCGLVVRRDTENWIKISTEFETEKHSRLGSVVTNRGYSDWATTDMDSTVIEMWYRIQSKGSDFLLEHSADGVTFRQSRICHLHEHSAQLQIGVYACSPMVGSFVARFDRFTLGPSHW